MSGPNSFCSVKGSLNKTKQLTLKACLKYLVKMINLETLDLRTLQKEAARALASYIDGTNNVKTIHEALPPTSGKKYIITKWWRSWSPI